MGADAQRERLDQLRNTSKPPRFGLRKNINKFMRLASARYDKTIVLIAHENLARPLDFIKTNTMKGEDLVKSYEEIWDKYAKTRINSSTPKDDDKLLDRGFVFEYEEGLKDVDILFVGINPSYTNGKSERFYYSSKGQIEISYFKSFKLIIDELNKKRTDSNNLTWSHIDMLVFRETRQSFIKDELLKTEEGNQFINEQLIISRQILEYLNPKIMVVSNTAARCFLGRDKCEKKGKKFGVWMGYDFEFDDDLGTDKIINNPKIEPYVFFTSMLSGQRALDNGSKQRLIWHINNVLNKITKT